MSEVSELIVAVQDLVNTLHVQAAQLQKLATHVEGQTTHLPHADEIPLVLSSLSELHVRLDRLPEAARAESNSVASV